MAHRRLLLALTVGLIARCVAGGGIGLEESRAADLEPGGDAHARVPMSTPACVACERVAREIADAAARMDGEDETLSEAENARRASRRRRGFHGRSEAAVDAALDAVCETLARSRVVEDADDDDDDANGGATARHSCASCETLLARHRVEIADRVFAEGGVGIREHLCVRLERVCPRVVGSARDEL
uniref:Saposin B-type domain-containing protein n=1 Tax=Micromonas pusilla TaxID=38833 RepID=A0A7S0I9D2_MICPS|mmetsp:Transcript_12625/g.53312  ORF Transcript_12625/g.53312 Transcript_12625/m.53312 type:complete len:186 (+) Transcript_12625:203-760(+)